MIKRTQTSIKVTIYMYVEFASIENQLRVIRSVSVPTVGNKDGLFF